MVGGNVNCTDAYVNTQRQRSRGGCATEKTGDHLSGFADAKEMPMATPKAYGETVLVKMSILIP